jgi:hypothetical protein
VLNENPQLFLSYVEKGWFDKGLADYLERELLKLSIYTFRLVRDRRVGEDWVELAHQKMRSADGTIAIWTHGGVKSDAMNEEIGFAIRNDLPLALVAEPGVALPEGLSGRRILVRVPETNSLSFGYSIFTPLSFNKRSLNEMVVTLQTWAWRQLAARGPRP